MLGAFVFGMLESMAGLTVSLNRPSYHGDHKVATGTITFDSSYPTGGEAFTPALVGLSSIAVVLFTPAVDTTPLALATWYDATNSKLLAFWSDNNGSNDSGLIQVADTTDLALYTCSFVAFGK